MVWTRHSWGLQLLTKLGSDQKKLPGGKRHYPSITIVFLVLAISSVAVAVAGIEFLQELWARESYGLVVSDKCLEPVRGLWHCISPYPAVPSAVSVATGILFSIVLLVPWELARGAACQQAKKRLFRLVSLAVVISWFPPVAAWWEACFITVPSRQSSVLGKSWELLTRLDAQFWNLYRFSFPWGQLVPLLILLWLLGESSDRKATLPCYPKNVRALGSFRTLHILFFAVLGFGFAYDLTRELIDYCFDLSALNSNLDPWYFLEWAVPAVAFVGLGFGRRWLLASAEEDLFEVGGEGSQKKAISFLWAICAVAVGLLILCLSFLIFESAFSVFRPDVVVDPRSAQTTVCPFLSSKQLRIGLWFLVGGFLLGETAKIITQELGMSKRLWGIVLVFQLGIVLPLAASVMWPWFRFAALQLAGDFTPEEVAAWPLAGTREKLPAWLLFGIASLNTWWYARALKNLSARGNLD